MHMNLIPLFYRKCVLLQQNSLVIHAQVSIWLIPLCFWSVALIYYSMLWCCDYVLMNG